MNRCPACPGINNCIAPEVGKCNDYTFVGEAPGRVENESGHVFWGKTGKEFTEHYLPLAGLRRGDVYITNAIKCLPPSPQGKLDINKKLDLDLLDSCVNHHLYNELLATQSKLIIPMGTFACYAIDPSINLELQHGIPVDTAFGTAFPMYHPASGLHEPKKMLMIRNDWVRLGKYIKGKLRLPVDPYPNPDYAEATHDELCELYHFVKANDTYGWPLGCDTEVTRQSYPYCFTFSTLSGTGRLILADNRDDLDILQGILSLWKGPILFHNWMFDSRVVRSMDLSIPDNKVIDTMVRVYHLGNMPQGLKALAYRELGMQMQDFDDLVTPYSLPKCLAYLREAYGMDWPKPDPELRRDDNGEWKLKQPQSMKTKLKRFLTDYGKNPNIDVFRRWDNWEDSHKIIESQAGLWPGKDIRYVPFEKIIHYACRDADALVRLWPLLQHMTRMVRKTVQENWV